MKMTEKIIPIWKYVADDFSTEKIQQTNLLIWPGGVSVVGFNANGNPGSIQTYMTRGKPDKEWVMQLLDQDVLLKNLPKKVTKIWLSEPRNLLIPASIYDENHAGSWLRKFHHLAPEETLISLVLPQPANAHIVFPIPSSLKDLLTYHYPKATFDALSHAAFLSKGQKGVEIVMVCLPQEITVILSTNGHFVYHLVFPYESANNVVYKLALILESKEISRTQVNKIYLFGIAPFWNNIIEELSQFFKLQTDGTDTTTITINFLKTLYQCAS